MSSPSGYFSVLIHLGQSDPSYPNINPPEKYETVPGSLDFQSCTMLKDTERTLMALFDRALAHVSQDPAEILEKENESKPVSLVDEIADEGQDGEVEEESREDLDRLNQIKQNLLSQVIEDRTEIENFWGRYSLTLPEQHPSIRSIMNQRKADLETAIQQYSTELRTIH